MFEVDIKINGCTIGHVYGINKGSFLNDGMWDYDYQYYDVMTGEVTKGTVKHNRKDLMSNLLYIIFKDIEGIQEDGSVHDRNDKGNTKKQGNKNKVGRKGKSKSGKG